VDVERIKYQKIIPDRPPYIKLTMASQVATDIRNAAIDGNTELVKQLLAQGADANSRMTTGT